MRRKVYISGKISGLPIEEARCKFATQQSILEGQGFNVVNPFDVNEVLISNGGSNWQEFMRADIKSLMDCDEIVMMPCWKQSGGAKIEHGLAKVIGIEIHYL